MNEISYLTFLTVLLVLTFDNKKIEILGVRIRKKTGEEFIRLHLLKDNQLLKGIEFTLEQMKNRAFQTKNFGVPLMAVDIQDLMRNIIGRYHTMNVIEEYEGLGLQYDKEGKVTGFIGAEALDEKGNIVVKDIEKETLTIGGSYLKIIQFLKYYLKGNIKRQVIILYGLAAILCGLLEKNILLSIVGNSRSGKTTGAKLALSLFSETEDKYLSKTFAATENFIIKSLDNLKGLLILLDDTSLSKIKDFTKIVYELIAGIEKGRLVKGNQPCKRSQWNASFIITSEKSVLFACDPDMEGVAARLMEINVEDTDLFDSSQHCNQAQKLYRESYGYLAVAFLSYLLKNGYADKIHDLHAEETAWVREGVESDGVMQSICEDIAIVTLTGRLAATALKLDFDIEAVKNFLIQTARGNLEEYRSLQTSNDIIEDLYYKLLEHGIENFPQYASEEQVFIESKALKAFLKSDKNGYKPLEVKRALKKEGLLEVNDQPNSYVITRGKESVKGICLIVRENIVREVV